MCEPMAVVAKLPEKIPEPAKQPPVIETPKFAQEFSSRFSINPNREQQQLKLLQKREHQLQAQTEDKMTKEMSNPSKRQKLDTQKGQLKIVRRPAMDHLSSKSVSSLNSGDEDRKPDLKNQRPKSSDAEMR